MTDRHVGVTRRAAPATDAIEQAVASAAGVMPSQVIIESRCDECGRPHGKPRVVFPRAHDGSEIVVSKSSAAGWVVTAVSIDARGDDLGVDIESSVQMSRARVDEAAFSDAERDLIDDEDAGGRALLRTRLWSQKEAYLKATGRGLRIDLTTVDLASGLAPDAVIVEVPLADPTLVLTVAMLGQDPVVVELLDRP
ncbi:4'-phosphopantetheinyl transferase superfamily protein [Agreia pratensis]|uniref:4'-phosphopantetheinyl transferase superfamily protein n=1 Tax=Agreia pratensis TaxID=150121 RepID=A0A1X7K5D6_9MICO|nr:4'-phosphopantetheinyl transferase superfamily protein [Agreia pratensis]MBF4634353.1 4'-phosphopantetheinyl transferase superfamily protein [Agreia pratensis]SMG36156.1 4'-phosphopantetheinyl transferase superfamily protein [Agreia pratensis]